MFSTKPKLLSSLPKHIPKSHILTAIFHAPNQTLPSINKTHAQIIVSGFGANAQLLGQLLASLAISPSTPFHYSLSVFRKIENPTTFAANNTIRCFAKSDFPRESIKFYAFMRRGSIRINNYTYPFVLQGCSKGLGFFEGVQVHAHVVKFGFCEDVFVRNTLIQFYCACSRIECAKRVFDESGFGRDVVTWNAILAGYVRDGQINVAKKLFDEMPKKNDISWSTMIMGYVQNGQLEEGLSLFNEMRVKCLTPNEAALVMVLSASAQLGLLEHGRVVHELIDSLNLPMTVSLGTTLIDMYSKCGCIEQSRVLFEKMPKKDRWTWNVMIYGLGTHGYGREALELFEKFVNDGKFRPVNVTFVGVLNACSRAGLVSDGRHYYKLMTNKYGIEPEMEHYGCMVDLLSRAGFIDEAVELVEKMPVSPDPVLYATLLGACKLHGLTEQGERIGEKLIQLDPTYDGHYVQLSGIYAKSKKWEDAARVRRLMSERNTNKLAGWSLIEYQNKVHRFVAGDREHGCSSDIYKMLEEIGRRIAEAGYIPNICSVLHDIGDEEKQNAVKEHSERLAIAFGLLVIAPGKCIRIVKNLRVCGDCHEVSKLISKVFEREIIVRDGSRFHHFKNGKCSCLDYW